jgi:hypothetical protein
MITLYDALAFEEDLSLIAREVIAKRTAGDATAKSGT